MINEKETSVGTPLTELLKIQIMERVSYAIDSIEDYYRLKFLDTQAPTHILKSRVLALFMNISSAIKRSPEKIIYSELKQNIFTGNTDTIINSFFEMNDWLDKKNIIRVDTKQTYDKTRVEIENSVNNL